MSTDPSNRSRVACLSCTRRKVKCSKTQPCNNCVRRGEQGTCDVGEARIAPATPSDTAHVSSIDYHSGSVIDRNELQQLRQRIAELERGSQQASPAPRPASVAQQAQHRRTTTQLSAEPQPSSSGQFAFRGCSEDPVAKNAASILEFLAWGRRKDPDYHVVVSPEVTIAHGRGSGDVGAPGTSGFLQNDFEDCSSLEVIQLLLPSPRQVRQLVEYHRTSLIWYHGSYFAPTFQHQLEVFYSQFHGAIEKHGVDLQWVGLLFSILTGSLVCAPPSLAQAWGFGNLERESLSRRWYQAVVTCLNKAGFAANLSILSCQAIATLTISAHVLGFSNAQSIHLAAAVRIAQSLGLHRLATDGAPTTMEKETGRRVWCQLCTQDWFGIPFSESYLINPLYSLSALPVNCHDPDLVQHLPEDSPTTSSYCRFLYRVASIMPQLQDALMLCNTAYTKYERVIASDTHLRTLAMKDRPAFLFDNPISASWPTWVPWARRALAISTSHKIIMIHRSFLSESFSNRAFAFTRRTCLAAAKTIIKEYKAVVGEDGPVLWIHQAFSVAASIILLLDILHRETAEGEYSEHKQLVMDVVNIFKTCQGSMIAARGIRLLTALLEETAKSECQPTDAPTAGQKRAREEDHDHGRPRKQAKVFDVPSFVKAFCEDRTTAPKQHFQPTFSAVDQEAGRHTSGNDNAVQDGAFHDFQYDQAYYNRADLNFAFPPAGLDYGNGFENLLYLANNDVYSGF